MGQFRKIASLLVVIMGLLSLDVHAAAITKKYSNFTYTEVAGVEIFGGANVIEALDGSLKYKGIFYPFKIRGLKLSAYPKEYGLLMKGQTADLLNLDIFSGTYSQPDGAILIDLGVNGAELKNQHGVIMRITDLMVDDKLSIDVKGATVELNPKEQ
jgi:hypothetical protein